MSKQREALQMALDALEKEPGDYVDFIKTMKAARSAIREALDETEPARNPLTDEEIDALRQSAQNLNFVTLREFKVIARAIERAHGIGEA